MVRKRKWDPPLAVLLLLAIITPACGPQGGCGNGTCDGQEDAESCPQDCAGAAAITPGPTTPASATCGDGACDAHENAQICPQDCTRTAAPSPPVRPPAPTPASPCGDGVCDGPENAQNCPQDCDPESTPVAHPASPVASPAIPAAPTPLPLYVTVYYHVEPNPQLFEAVEPGKFEAVSLSIRHMSTSLAAIDVHATFCFAWLYNDLVYCRNRDPQTGVFTNSSADTGIETFEQLLAGGHELAYHTHPPMAIVEGGRVYYARPNTTCDDFAAERHRWSGLGADANYDFLPGVYQFDDSTDPWYGQFTWERTSESLFLIADFLGTAVRHPNGGQRPLLDIMNVYGEGINHPYGIQQLRSLMGRGFGLVASDVMAFFRPEYAATGRSWSDPSTGHVSYFGREANVQIYYPDIDGAHLENAATTSQGLTFMPVQTAPQAAWMSGGARDDDYYNAQLLGGTGGGGVQWTEGTFYHRYRGRAADPWGDTEGMVEFPSLAEQFNSAMQRHQSETPNSVNAWGFDHHILNVMWADLSGLSDNWDRALAFMRDIADGLADGVANDPRTDLVQFVTMQELAAICDGVVLSSTR